MEFTCCCHSKNAKKSFSFISLEFSNCFQCEPQSCPNDLHSHVIEIRRADQVLQFWGNDSWQRTIADLLHKARNAMSIKWNLPGRVTMGQGPSDRFSGIAWSPQVTSKNLSSRAMRTSHKECNLPRKTSMNVCFALCKFQKPSKQACLGISQAIPVMKQLFYETNCFMKSRCLILHWESNPSTTCRMAKHRAFPGWQIQCVSCKTPDWNLDLGCGIGLIFHPNQFVVDNVKCLGTFILKLGARPDKPRGWGSMGYLGKNTKAPQRLQCLPPPSLSQRVTEEGTNPGLCKRYCTSLIELAINHRWRSLVSLSAFCWVSRPWFLQYRSLPSSKTSGCARHQHNVENWWEWIPAPN